MNKADISKMHANRKAARQRKLRTQREKAKEQAIKRALQAEKVKSRLCSLSIVKELEWAERALKYKLDEDNIYRETDGKQGRKLNRTAYSATVEYANLKLRKLQAALPKETHMDLTSDGENLFGELAEALRQSVRSGSERDT